MAKLYDHQMYTTLGSYRSFDEAHVKELVHGLNNKVKKQHRSLSSANIMSDVNYSLNNQGTIYIVDFLGRRNEFKISKMTTGMSHDDMDGDPLLRSTRERRSYVNKLGNMGCIRFHRS